MHFSVTKLVDVLYKNFKLSIQYLYNKPATVVNNLTLVDGN